MLRCPLPLLCLLYIYHTQLHGGDRQQAGDCSDRRRSLMCCSRMLSGYAPIPLTAEDLPEELVPHVIHKAASRGKGGRHTKGAARAYGVH